MRLGLHFDPRISTGGLRVRGRSPYSPIPTNMLGLYSLKQPQVVPESGVLVNALPNEIITCLRAKDID